MSPHWAYHSIVCSTDVTSQVNTGEISHNQLTILCCLLPCSTIPWSQFQYAFYLLFSQDHSWYHLVGVLWRADSKMRLNRWMFYEEKCLSKGHQEGAKETWGTHWIKMQFWFWLRVTKTERKGGWKCTRLLSVSGMVSEDERSRSRQAKVGSQRNPMSTSISAWPSLPPTD